MAGFPNGGGGGGGSVTITSPDGSIDIGGTTSAPTVITDAAKVVRQVNGVSPTAGNVNVTAVPINLKTVNYITSVAVDVTVNYTSATLDGITLAANQVWLFLANTNGATNNAYVVGGSAGAWTWTLSTNFNTQTLLLDAIVNNLASTNSVQAYSQYQLATQAPITVGTTPLSWQATAQGIPTNGAQNLFSLRTLDFTNLGAMPGDWTTALDTLAWTAINVPPQLINGATSVTNATPMCLLTNIYLPANVPVNNLHCIPTGTIAAGITHSWMFLTDSSLNLLANTADVTTAPAINTDYSQAIVKTAAGAATSYTPSVGGLYKIGILVVATTTVTMTANTGIGTQFAPLAQTGQSASAGTLTTPPAYPFTFGALTNKGPTAIVGVS